MHRLFWKIFLSFWAALILFAGATMLTASHYLDQMRAQDEAASPRERMQSYVAEGQGIADREGLEGIKTWLRELDRREVVPWLLVDGGGEDLLGRPVPERIGERVARRAERSWRSRGRFWSRLTIRLPDQSEYFLIPDFQSVTLGRVLQRPRVIALPLIVAALASGLVCFLLTRYLTAPIGRLRRATEAYAGGNLSERVAPTLGSRKDEIADLARAFDRMAQHLQELISSQRQLLSDVSHELRSPLARVQVALGLARQRAEGRAGPEFDRIEGETERLNELIGQLLSLARLEAGVAPVSNEPVDVAELLAAVASDADFEARAGNRRVEITKTVSARIRGNTELLRSALENIVRNALRYTPEGTAVELSMDRDSQRPDGTVIEVRDRGPGVPEEMLPRLFEPFVRVSDARDRASGGYGLGLAIADKAVRLHGGKLSARNALDGGLCVAVSLPVSPADSTADRR
jgi:two-component system sensor histidine kinase CpxA